MKQIRWCSRNAGFVVLIMICPFLRAEDPADDDQRDDVSREILTPLQWKRVDESVDSGLRFLATQQREDGAFNAPDTGRPGITSLCIMAFLSRGHLPNEGPYGTQLNRAIRFVMSKQRKDGLLFNLPIGRWTIESPAHTAIYNHAIAALMLSEVYGMSETRLQEPIRRSISKALRFTLNHQSKFNRHEVEQGGWRYVTLGPQRDDADLSITAWQLLFLRSAKNAEFQVPKERIDAAMGYVRRSFNAEKGTFTYAIVIGQDVTRAMAGAGIVSLAMGGEHDSQIARQAGDWLLSRDFDRYNQAPQYYDRYHYGVYYCSQAMFQLGGDYWSKFYPRAMKTLMDHQGADGSWDRESASDGVYGNAYTTALAILSLTPPYEILPIYQR